MASRWSVKEQPAADLTEFVDGQQMGVVQRGSRRCDHREFASQDRRAERLGRQAKTIVGAVAGPSASIDSSDAICSGSLDIGDIKFGRMFDDGCDSAVGVEV